MNHGLQSTNQVTKHANQIIRRILVLILLFFCLFVKNSFAISLNSAKPMIEVSPFILNVSLSPGKIYKYEINVKNLLQTPLPLHALIENLEEGGAQTISSWSTLDQSEMIIPAGQTRTLNLTIRLPKKILFGGYYGSLYLEPLPVTNANGQLVQAKIGIPILANIGVIDPKAKQGEILDFAIDKLIYGNQDQLNAQFKVKNVSLYHFSAKPFLLIRPLWGQEDRYELDERIVLPGKTREWDSPITIKNYFSGLYFAKLQVSVGAGRQEEANTTFIILPSDKKLSLILIPLGIILIYFGSKRKHNFAKALKAFMEKS